MDHDAAHDDPAQHGAVVTWLRDRRRAPRHRVIQRGQIAWPDRALQCVVLDISARGARLWLPERIVPSALLILRIAGAAERIACRRWQRGQEMGVEVLPG